MFHEENIFILNYAKYIYIYIYIILLLLLLLLLLFFLNFLNKQNKATYKNVF